MTKHTKANSHIEVFDYDLIKSSKEGRPINNKMKGIFDYNNRNLLNKNAHVEFYDL